MLCLGGLAALQCIAVAAQPAINTSVPRVPPNSLTNLSQLQGMSSLDLNRGRPFSVRGTVTLVDTNRNMLVLQEGNAALAFYLDVPVETVRPGQLVSVRADSGSAYFANCPDYPYHPAGWDYRTTFEAPSNWGDFHLQRMSGFLHPPVTGEYTFWIASDNSSELWLSYDDNPTHERKIAGVDTGFWVNPNEWSRYPSQRSEPIFLRADRAYYIEAFAEQLTVDDHLSVAWQVPGMARSIIDGSALTPWNGPASGGWPGGAVSAVPTGVLREYWTNYSVGNVTALTVPRPLTFGITAHGAELSVLGEGTWPEPKVVEPGQALTPELNFRFVEAEGAVNFLSLAGSTLDVELVTTQKAVVARIPGWNQSLPQRKPNERAVVRGVCEAARDETGQLIPGFIWVQTNTEVAFFSATNSSDASLESLTEPTNRSANVKAALGGFYYNRGVVTFNSRVFNQDRLVVQDQRGGAFISQTDRPLRAQLEVGQSVEVGGDLLPGKYSPSLRPEVVNVLGWQAMPDPIIPPEDDPASAYRDGQWTELHGVVRAVKADGTAILKGTRSPVTLWVDDTTTNELSQWIDASVRVKGVMSLGILDAPLLLVPSRSFVEVEEAAPTDAFAPQASPISDFKAPDASLRWPHRVTVGGVVTYRDAQSFFLQDASGGARIRPRGGQEVRVGDSVTVAGFADPDNSGPIFDEALVRPAEPRTTAPLPQKTALTDLLASPRHGVLVRLQATLLAQKTDSHGGEVLELQEGRRVFEAVLGAGEGHLPPLPPGGLVDLTGVCLNEMAAPPAGDQAHWDNPQVASVQILLRSPSDVVLLKSPPWWSWKEAAVVLGILTAVLGGALLWIHLMRLRFERQQTARLAFARQLLQSQENERRRIAANLHDSLGQNLLVIKNQVHLALQSAPNQAELVQRLEGISGTALEALEEVRQITHDLGPYQLDRLGLTRAIRASIRLVSENCPIEFASHVDEIDGVFDKESEIHIYRIVQEALSNVVKHSGATEAAVVVKKETTALSLSIRDNGRGFAAAGPAGQNGDEPGFGLNGIHERTRILHAIFEIDTAPAQGVNLKLQVPLPTPKPCNPESKS